MATGLRTKAQRRFLEAATAERAQPGTKLLGERAGKVNTNTIGVFERNALALLARNPYHARAHLLCTSHQLQTKRGRRATRRAQEATRGTEEAEN